MWIRPVIAAAFLVASFSACSRDHTLACEPTDRYMTATSSPPVRIPDDLSPPDESESLRLPPEGGTTAPPSRPCLETPPGFYAEGAPGGTRLGVPAARAPQPPAEAPAEAPATANAPSDDSVSDPNREIGN
jgi:hypothetical protein